MTTEAKVRVGLKHILHHNRIMNNLETMGLGDPFFKYRLKKTSRTLSQHRNQVVFSFQHEPQFFPKPNQVFLLAQHNQVVQF